jgi:hypothetical protein
MTFKVTAPIQHDGEVFVPGETVDEGQFGGKEGLRALVSAGVVVEEREAEELVEPPPNYREPDLRLGTGDLNAEGAATLAIDLPTPTNVPKPMDPAKAPDPGTLGVTAPQRAVFEKMARLAAEKEEADDQPSLEDLQEQREDEQGPQVGDQRGGEQDEKRAQEKAPKKAAPTPVKAGKEEPSPALKAGRDEGTQ